MCVYVCVCTVCRRVYHCFESHLTVYAFVYVFCMCAYCIIVFPSKCVYSSFIYIIQSYDTACTSRPKFIWMCIYGFFV